MPYRLKNLLSVMNNNVVPFNFAPKNLQNAYELVRTKYEEGDLQPPLDLSIIIKKIEREVIQNGKEVNDVLNNREQMFIPLLAFRGDPAFLENEKFYDFCRSQIKSMGRSTIYSRWLHTLLKYRNFNSKNVRHTCDLFTKQLSTYEGGSPRVRTWKENSELILSSEKNIARYLLHQGRSFSEFLSDNRLSSELLVGGYADKIVNNMISECAAFFPRFLTQTLRELKYTDSDGKTYYRGINVIRHAASELIKAVKNSNSDEHRDKIIKPILAILGDPRVTTNIFKWDGVDPEAKDIMRQWLSERDIEFFFEIVSKTEDQLGLDTHWEYRKAFWMAYLPYIQDSWVLMGAKARAFAKHYIHQHDLSNTDFGKLKGADSTQSVFFLRIKDVEFVEYSHQGALRIWNYSTSPLKFRSKEVHVDTFRAHAPPHLKRIRHLNSENYGWQYMLAYWIRENLGVEPTQSYRIE